MRPSGHAPIKPRDTAMRQQKTMPLTQHLRHACAFALVLFACAFAAPAQQNDNTAAKPHAKNIAGMSSSDAPNGAKVMIISDSALSDYSAYRSGDRFYVVIPQANAKSVGGVRGRGFEGAQVTKRGQDVVMSFKLQPGASAHVEQHFNKLVVHFNAADVGVQTPPKNTNQQTAQPTPDPRAQPTRTPVEPAGTPTPTPLGRATPDINKQTIGALPPGVVPTPLVSPTSITQTTPTPAVPTPSATPTSTTAATPEQIAQLRPTPAAPVVTTNAPASGASVSLGTTVLRNWPWLLIALIVLAGLGLFVFARGGERRAELPPAAAEPTRPKETPKSALAAKEPAPVATTAAITPPVVAPPVVTPPVVAAPPVIAPPLVVVAPQAKVATPPKSKKAKRAAQKREAAAAAKAAELEAAAVTPQEASTTATVEPSTTAGITGAIIAGAGAAALMHDEFAPAAIDAESAVAETKKLLAGEVYDESVIGTQDASVRQLVASELMTALATESESEQGERARAAFIKYGYFDDAARDLRTAEALEQRSSAARTLGLLGDQAATQHLLAALEDPAAEVRRAAVEALTELQYPAAVGPLEALRWRETSRQLPRSMIQTAIEACAAAAPAEVAAQTEADDTLAEDTLTAEPAAVAPAFEDAPAPEVVTDETALAVDETTQEVARVPAEEQTETAEQEPTHVSAPIESAIATEWPAVAAVPEIAPAPEAAPAEAVETIAPPAVVEQMAEAMPVIETAPAVEAAETTAAPEQQIETADEPAAAELFAPPQTAPEVVEHVEFALPTTEVAAVETSALADTFVLSEPAPVVITEPTVAPVEPDLTLAAPAVEKTKAITAFEMTPSAPVADEWIDIDVEEQRLDVASPAPLPSASTPRVSFDAGVEEHAPAAWTQPDEVSVEGATDAVTMGLEPSPVEAMVEAAPAVSVGKELDLAGAEEERLSIIPKAIQLRLESEDVSERAASVLALAQLNTDEAFQQICTAFDDSAPEVREAAARALYSLADDRADSFTRALREAAPERRRHIGAAISAAGLADEAVSNLTGESRDKTYDAFSLLFLMAKAGETVPLIHAVETHPDNEVRLAVVKLLALSGQHEILPSFRRLAVRGSLPTEVRSAVMEAIYQISSQPQHTT